MFASIYCLLFCSSICVNKQPTVSMTLVMHLRVKCRVCVTSITELVCPRTENRRSIANGRCLLQSYSLYTPRKVLLSMLSVLSFYSFTITITLYLTLPLTLTIIIMRSLTLHVEAFMRCGAKTEESQTSAWANLPNRYSSLC